jgi:hypothetical protein
MEPYHSPTFLRRFDWYWTIVVVVDVMAAISGGVMHIIFVCMYARSMLCYTYGMHTRTNVWICVQLCVFVCVYIYIICVYCMYVYMYEYIYIHICVWCVIS